MKRRLARLYRRAQRALRPGTVLPREHARLGDLARDAGDWVQAREHYLRALAGDSSLVAIWVQLGHAHKVASDIPEAEKAYRQALLLDPENADSWLQLGHVLRLQGKLGEARESYEQSAALSPDNPYAAQEAASLGGSVAVLRQARRPLERASRSPCYGSRRIGPGRLVLDITGALDHGHEVAAVIAASMASQYEDVDSIRWRDGRWYTHGGLAYEFPKNCAAMIVTGPWLSSRPDHIEGVLYDTRSRDVPILGGLLDLSQPPGPGGDTQDAVDASTLYLGFLNEVGSGIVTFLDLYPGDIQGAAHFGGQVVAIRSSLPIHKPEVEAGPILVFGDESSEEMKVIKAAINALDPEEASRFRIARSPTSALDGARASGGLLAAADAETRLNGLIIAAQGRPLGIAAHQGLSGLAKHAAMRLPARDVASTSTQLRAFASLCEQGTMEIEGTSPAGQDRGSESLRHWKVRLGDRPAGARLSIMQRRTSAPVVEMDSRLVIKPESLALLAKDGFCLTNNPVHLGVVSGEEPIVAMLLVTAPTESDHISIHIGKGPPTVQVELSRGTMKWLKVPLSASHSCEAITISAGNRLQQGSPRLLAVCIYPASQPHAWADFLDQIARGAHPQMRSLGRQTAENN